MSLIIRYSLRARREKIRLLQYIKSEFGDKSAEKVNLKFNRLLFDLSRMPKMFPEFENLNGIRRCVFSKQTSIYYRIHHEYLEIISIQDNRVNQDQLGL